MRSVLDYTTRYIYNGSTGTTTTNVNDTWNPVAMANDKNGNELKNFPDDKAEMTVNVNRAPMSFTLTQNAKPNEPYNTVTLAEAVGDEDEVEFVIYKRIL